MFGVRAAMLLPLPGRMTLSSSFHLRIRTLICIAAAVLLAATNVQAQSFKTGSFLKTTTAGSSVPQSVAHGLGVEPKAIIFWMSADSGGAFFTNQIFAFGMTDGTTSISSSAASHHNQAVANTSRRMAYKAITITAWSENTLAEADLTSWDSTNFNLNWTTSDATAWRIYYLAIGGDYVSASVVNWQTRTTTGSQAVTGVGMRPDVVIHAHAGSDFTASLPAGSGVSQAGAFFGLGVMDLAGGQWANGFNSQDAVSPTASKRGQRGSGSAIYMFNTAASDLKNATLVSMDSDGFTMNFDANTDGTAAQMYSLALRGVKADAGNFNKSATAGSNIAQAVTGIGFKPAAVLFSSNQNVSSAFAQNHARFGIGVADGTSVGSTSIADAHAVNPSNAFYVDKTTRAFMKVDNTTQTIAAEATFTSRDPDGFTLSWTTNDAVATQMVYLALAERERNFVVGTFTKNTTSAANCVSGCPTNVVAHGLGFTPKALILWTTGKINETAAASYHFGFGVSDGTTDLSASASSGDNIGTSNASRRMTAKALTVVQYGEVLVAEADLTSWDEKSFTLTWTTNNTTAGVIHYMVIGGTEVDAKAIAWQTPSGVASKAVTGVGFSPDAVVHFDHGYLAGASSAHASFNLGVMDSSGNQWASSRFSVDAAGTSTTQGGQRTDSAIVSTSNMASFASRAQFTSMDADGFTLNFVTNASGVRDIYSLALKGLQVKAGTFTKSVVWSGCPAACVQPVTGVGFEPSAVILSSIFDTAQANPVAQARLLVGASDGTTEGTSAFYDTNGLNTTDANALDRVSRAFTKIAGTGFLNSSANLTSFDADGFTLTYPNNDNVANEIVYLAFAPTVVTAVDVTALNATRYGARVLVEWRTGYEVDNLGFHVYRELNGERTRVTQTLLAGSGLMAGQGTATRGEQRYAYWDQHPQASDRSAVYWLEDLDFNGARTWHGPVMPAEGGLQVAPELAPVTALRDLGKQLKRRGKVFSAAGPGSAAPSRALPHGSRGAALSPEIQTQRSLAAQPAIKIGVSLPGWYRVTQPELVAAGLDVQVDPAALRLFADGVEHAITVTGASDGRFDATDSVEFYGTGVDTPYTDTRTYWLTSEGRGGRRTIVRNASGSLNRSSAAATFPFVVQQKERSIYFAALRNGDHENWFGAFISEEPTDLPFNVSNIAFGTTAEIEVTLQGVTSTPNHDPDHRVGILVNGTEVGVAAFDGQSHHAQTFAIPAGVLAEGTNTVTIVAQGGEADYSLVDVIRLNYAHVYRADADLLRFTAEGPGDVTVTGFASSAIRIMDVTDPANVEELRGTVSPDGGFSAISIRIPNQGPRNLLAFTDATISTPASVRTNVISKWSAAENASDYIAVTHSAFADSVAPLLERHAQRGLSVAQIDIEDVYDEFSFGEKTPQAVRDLVTVARTTWKTAPRFLLLVGDATLDPRDYAGFGDADFVPSKSIPMSQIALETVSDEWFADADDDGLPEVAVGRLPARTADQADAMIAKILAYDDSGSDGWTRNVLLVAGERDESGNFDKSSSTLQTVVPSTYTVRRVSTDASGADVARHQLLDAVNAGQLIVNYIGHGSTRIWGREYLLSSEDVADTWRNAGRLPLVVAMNCLNGFFHGIYDEESLAETLLRTSGGGAVAAWASSGITHTATQALVNQQLFRLLFSDPTLTIGQAAILAKGVVSDRDIRRSWIFFGDPALRLKGVQPVGDTTTDASVSMTVTAVTVSVTSSAPAPTSPVLSADTAFRLSDWNGDGSADVFLHAQSGWRATLSAPRGESVQTGQWTAAWEVHPADLNGDGIEDLVLVDRATGVMVRGINDGAGNFEYADGLLGSEWKLHVADLNGDGKDDLLLTMPDFGFWFTLLNEGDGHFTSRPGSWLAGASLTLGDFNADSRTDAFLYNPESGVWTIAFSDGAGDFTYVSGNGNAGSTVQRIDVDGDARADLLFYNPETGVWEEWGYEDQGRFVRRTGLWKTGLTVRAVDGTRGQRDDVLLYDATSGEWTFVMIGKDTQHASGVWSPGMTIATGDLNGDRRTDLLLHDHITGVWIKALRREAGAFDFTTGQWEPGWRLALER